MAKKTINVIYKVEDGELRKVKTTIAGAEAETEKWNKELKKTGELTHKVGQDGVKSFLSWKNVISSISVVGLAYSIGSLAKKIFDLGVAQEQTNIAFTTFLGSAEKAKQLMAELTKFSIVTPFTPEQVNKAAKTLLAFDVAAQDIIPTLKMLGDVSAGTGKDLSEMAVIFGQIRSTGRLMGQDLLQLINAGFNPLQIISKKTGQSVADLKKDMEKGLITFEMVADAFKTATSEGGLFFNLMEAQSNTVGGKLSTIQGNLEEIGKALYANNNGPLADLVDNLVVLTGNVNAISDALSRWISLVTIVPRKTIGFFAWVAEQAREAAREAEKAKRPLLELQLQIQESLFNAPGGTAEGQREIFKEIIRLRTELGIKTGTTEDPLPWVNEKKNDDLQKQLGLVQELKKKLEDINKQIESTTNKKDLGPNGKLIKLREQYQDQLDALMGKENKDASKRDKEALENTRKHLKEKYEERVKKAAEAAARERENDKRSFEHWKYYDDLRRQKQQETEDEEFFLMEQAAERKARINQTIFDSAIQISRSIVDAATQEKESKIESINEYYEEQIRLAGDNERKRKELEVEKDRAVKQAREHEKEEYKALSLKKILAETAINIVEAYPDPYRILAAVALGGIQAASVQRLKDGGLVKGPGNETSDSVPILASKNEFVVKAKSANRSRDLLDLINKGDIDDRILRKAAGGSVFNDGRIVSEIAGMRSDLNKLQQPDVVEQNGVLYRSIRRGKTYRQLIKTSILSQ